MSIDKSLVSKASLSRQRSVLTRAERVQRLIDEGKWKEGGSVFGLPKVRVKIISRKKGKAKAAPAAAAAGVQPAAEAAAASATPAAKGEAAVKSAAAKTEAGPREKPSAAKK